MESFDFIRTNKAINISKASPLADINNRVSNIKPTHKPRAPRISNTIVSSPNFSILNRLNSFFILGEIK